MQRLRVFSFLLLIFTFAACTQKESTQVASADANVPSRTVAAQAPQNQPPASSSAALQPAAPPATAPPPVVQTRTLEIPAGTTIPVRNNQPIDSSQVVPGQAISAHVNSDVRDAHGRVVLPRGAAARLIVESASEPGKIKGAADLVLLLQSVSFAGQRYTVHTSAVREQGSKGIGKNKRTGKFLGGGAAIGGIIGGIAGGGKGALIGGASGAAAGGAAQVVTRDKSVKIPAETLMTFRLQRPVQVVERHRQG